MSILDMAENSPGAPRFTADDLDEANRQDCAVKLNRILGGLFERLGQLASGKFDDGITARKLYAEEQDTRAIKDNELVTYATLKKLSSPQAIRESFVVQHWQSDPVLPISGAGGIISQSSYGTHQERIDQHPPALKDNGTFFVETDRKLVYQVQSPGGGKAWVYVAGTYSIDQADIAALAATLTANDNGLLIYVSDFAHVLKWASPSFDWGDGDRSGRFAAWDDSTPGVGWHLCDGSTVPRLNADGTTTNVALPDLVANAAAAAYIKYGSPYGGTPNAAVAPGISGSTDSATTGISLDNAGGGGEAESGTGAPTTGSHNHGVTDPGHPHGAGSLTADATGEPRHIIAVPYYRQ